MDKLNNYRTLIRQRMIELSELINQQHPSSESGIETSCVFDDERSQYLLLKTGWCGSKRVRGTILHVRLRDGKVWIEDDLTEDGIATYLLAAEVPKSDIVLAFQSPETRKFTEFAVA